MKFNSSIKKYIFNDSPNSTELRDGFTTQLNNTMNNNN